MSHGNEGQLDILIEQLRAVQAEILNEMIRIYPIGTRVILESYQKTTCLGITEFSPKRTGNGVRAWL